MLLSFYLAANNHNPRKSRHHSSVSKLPLGKHKIKSGFSARLPPASRGDAGCLCCSPGSICNRITRASALDLEILSLPARMKAVQWLSPEAARLIMSSVRAASFNASYGGET
jgi:hypothetical protein